MSDCKHDRLEYWEVNELHRRYQVRYDGKTAFASDNLEDEDSLESREPRAVVRRFFLCPDCGDAWDTRQDEQGRWVKSGPSY